MFQLTLNQYSRSLGCSSLSRTVTGLGILALLTEAADAAEWADSESAQSRLTEFTRVMQLNDPLDRQQAATSWYQQNFPPTFSNPGNSFALNFGARAADTEPWSSELSESFLNSFNSPETTSDSYDQQRQPGHVWARNRHFMIDSGITYEVSPTGQISVISNLPPIMRDYSGF